MLIKLTTSPWLVVSFYRHVFAVPGLLLAWAFARNKSLPWRAASFGGVLFAAHQLFHFAALRNSTAAVVTILFSLQPILIGALGRRFVGEEATVRFYLWSSAAVVACAVVVLVSTGEATTSPLGAALSVSNLIAWCAYYLASKKARAEVTTISWLLVMTVVSGAVLGVIAVVARAPFASPIETEWLYIAAIALLPGTLGHLLVTWAHPRIHVAASSAVTLGVPIVATAGAAIFVGESFGPVQAVAALAALAATGLAMRHLPPMVTEEAVERYGEVAT